MNPTLVACAWLLDLVLGDPRGLPHPVVWIGRLISALEARLRRSFANLTLAGVILTLSVLALTALATWGLLAASVAFHRLLGLLAWLWVAHACLATRALHAESAEVVAYLRAGRLDEARTALSWLVSRDTTQLDEEGILRATCETVAENTSDGIVAPLCFLCLGGPVAAMTYKAASTLDSMVGYKNERYLRFGWASARLDDLLNLFPARLTALLTVLAAPLVGLNGWRALVVTLRDARKSASPNAGFPMAAAAGALGVRFGGTAVYFGAAVEKPVLGGQNHPFAVADYHRAIRLMYAVSALALLLGVTLLVLFHGGWR